MKSINIEGFEEIAKKLQELPKKLEKNILRSALNAGARVYANELKATAPKDSGALKRTIRVSSRIRKDKKGIEAVAKVGNRDKGVFYAHMVEFGTNAHAINAKQAPNLSFMIGGKWVKTKQVLHTGTSARPFIRTAYDNKASQAVDAISSKIRTRLKEIT